MADLDYDDATVEEEWCADLRADISAYLSGEGVSHGQIGEWPAWHVAPYVSIWAIESQQRPGWVGWWAIAGDLPTDYVSAKTIKDPRAAVSAFSERWIEVSSYMLRGEAHPDIRIGSSETWPQLGPLLKSRASLLAKWVNENSFWQDADTSQEPFS